MTSLCYFRDAMHMCCEATISKFQPADAETKRDAIIVVNKTPFYPQGGGQPSDKGIIYNDSSRFDVRKVTFSQTCQGEVDHAGVIQEGNTFKEGDRVFLEVDDCLRTLHNRLHSAGHVVDAAISNLGITNLVAGKAYHFADGPYVEYSIVEGNLILPKEEFIRKVEEECNNLIELDLPVYIDYANDNLEDTSCERKMRIADIISIPCGGTHVDRLGQIGGMIIRKIENKKGRVKVSYQISDSINRR